MVLNNLSLTVRRGETKVVIGRSGVGKSVLLKSIVGLVRPESGSIKVNGLEVTSLNEQEYNKLRMEIGMVFQQYSSLPWLTVLENVALGLTIQGIKGKERKDRAMEMLDLVGLADHRDKFAKYPTLSGGQLQRVAIARSLLVNPRILLMDEPFGALDVQTRMKMQDLLLSIWEKYQSTILFVTHDIPEAVYLGQEILIMSANPGTIVDRVHIDLPRHRDRDTKRSGAFLEHVRDIEDRMMALEDKRKH
jgi:NitT/TauT family transport system ATP-binding protein